jgi:hypothetical protein
MICCGLILNSCDRGETEWMKQLTPVDRRKTTSLFFRLVAETNPYDYGNYITIRP